ncbi:MAG: hypothetical protein Q7U38_05180 [Methylobacter sp.]|nr:hypothetical protein [Methylobacter sp.]MDP2097150.1 hypothetical protein [Methylobacter sp.]MDP2427029.1 hypothetical protein [Methylobacter sp.]MDP3055687.1 hypothetical protein [Methylobacter sp.]MDP3363886.1 hypothetical protein [Methylobacter sp.]
MKKINKTPFAAAMGAAFLSTFAATGVNAEANPFGMTELSSGYMQVAEADKAAEMACGAAMGGMEKPKTAEGACAGNKAAGSAKPAAKAADGACGAMMKGKEGACGDMMKGKEGACGAQCGEGMKGCDAAKTKEGACGAMMKGCGEGMQGCGEMMKGMEGACGDKMKTDGAKAKDAAGH